MQSPLSVPIKRLPGGDGLALPEYHSVGAAGMVVLAAVTGTLRLEPGRIETVPSGFAIALPEGYEAQLRPRSGLAAQHGITLVNSPGTIDADYRGEVLVA